MLCVFISRRSSKRSRPHLLNDSVYDSVNHHFIIVSPIDEIICSSLKCNVIYILRNRKDSGIINMFGITRVECAVIYNKFRVIRTLYSTLWSPSFNYCCIRYKVTNFNKLFVCYLKMTFKKSSDHTIICSGIL